MSENDVVLVDIADRVAVITLNRPDQRNALNRAVRKALPAAITRCDEDDDVDVMILTGNDPAFCAGVDLKEFGSGRCSRAKGLPSWGREDGRSPFAALRRKPANPRGVAVFAADRGRAQLRLDRVRMLRRPIRASG